MPLGSLLLEHSAIDGVSVCVELSDCALGYIVFMLLAAYGASGSLYIGRFRAVYSASSHFPQPTLYGRCAAAVLIAVVEAPIA